MFSITCSTNFRAGQMRELANPRYEWGAALGPPTARMVEKLPISKFHLGGVASNTTSFILKDVFVVCTYLLYSGRCTGMAL